jgi:hypothetical protein
VKVTEIYGGEFGEVEYEALYSRRPLILCQETSVLKLTDLGSLCFLGIPQQDNVLRVFQHNSIPTLITMTLRLADSNVLSPTTKKLMISFLWQQHYRHQAKFHLRFCQPLRDMSTQSQSSHLRYMPLGSYKTSTYLGNYESCLLL